jgi:hypothetical protein
MLPLEYGVSETFEPIQRITGVPLHDGYHFGSLFPLDSL